MTSGIKRFLALLIACCLASPTSAQWTDVESANSDPDLILHVTGDSDNNGTIDFTDTGTGGYSWTQSGTVTAVDPPTGIPGKGMTFSSGNNLVTSGNVSQLSGAAVATYMYWWKPATQVTSECHVSWRQDNNNRFASHVGTVSGANTNLSVNASNAGAGIRNSNANLLADNSAWAHWAIVYDGSLTGNTKVVIYKDGVDVSGSSSGTIQATLPAINQVVRLGARVSATDQPGNGAMADFRYYNQACTQAEIEVIRTWAVSASTFWKLQPIIVQ